jgi:hypothetical protein
MAVSYPGERLFAVTIAMARRRACFRQQSGGSILQVSLPKPATRSSWSWGCWPPASEKCRGLLNSRNEKLAGRPLAGREAAKQTLMLVEAGYALWPASTTY